MLGSIGSILEITMKTSHLVLILACSFLVSSDAWAQSLKVGSDAPTLSIATWAKGDPVDLSKAKKDEVYIIEFWATWCGPCLRGIPHMSEMQDHFRKKGVTFVGISDEKAKTVTDFLAKGWDAKMRYTVAIDKNNQTNKDWMKAAGQNGIPTAFVVQNGKIKWIGHPASGLDIKIAELTGDTEFVEKAKKTQELQGKIRASFQAQDWKKAVESIDNFLEVKPDAHQMRIMKYYVYGAKLKDKAATTKSGEEFIAKCDDANMLNAFAWGTLTDEAFKDMRDLKLTLAAAAKAVKVSKGKHPAILDTYANALAESGDLAAAIKTEKQAIEVCTDPKQLVSFKASLAKYEKQAGESKK
jgi:thiol-disulfide isomerase/thioredoxin